MSQTIPTNQGPMTPTQVVDFLTYRCYEFNRDHSPRITAEQWAIIFGEDTPALEEIYLQNRVQKVEATQ